MRSVKFFDDVLRAGDNVRLSLAGFFVRADGIFHLIQEAMSAKQLRHVARKSA
jgi:hypothetical protein